MRSFFAIVLLCALPLVAQKYAGPRPAKADVPYLVHADNLVETESAEAKQEERKGDTIFVVAGAHSTARTPLSSPVFLIRADQLEPNKLQLYKMESKGDERQVLFTRKKKMTARPIRLNVTRADENLWRIEVDEILENGEYSLTPEGSNQVFCFQIF